MSNYMPPSMEDFIRSLNQPDGSGIVDTTEDCTICFSILHPNDFPGEHGDVKRMPPCGHLFHKQCIKNSLNSIANKRNCCPNCRAKLCKLNVLSPEKEAARQAAENEGGEAMNDFNTDMYTEIIRRTDDAFEVQQVRYKPQGCEDYVRITSEVRQAWTRDGYGDERCCHDHVVMGWDWFEDMVVDRVREQLQAAGDYDTDQGRVFMAWHHAMRARFENRWLPAPAENEDADEPAEQNGGVVDDIPEDGAEVVENAQHDGQPAVEGPEAVPLVLDEVPEAEDDARVQEPLNTPGFAVPVAAAVLNVNSQQTTSPPAAPPGQSIPVAPLTNRNLQDLADRDREASPVTAHTDRGRADRARRDPNRADRTRQDRERDANRSRSPVSSYTRNDQGSDSETNFPSSTPSRQYRQYRQGSPARRRSLARSPRDRIAAARVSRELRHFRQSHFRQERRRLERHYDIVMELKDAGPVTALGGMQFRVKGRDGRTIAVVKDALNFSVIGDTTVFYRLKT